MARGDERHGRKPHLHHLAEEPAGRHGRDIALDSRRNAVGTDDQVLNLMQMYFERSDSVNFGRHLFLEPFAGVSRRHALHVYGTNDSYAPIETQRLYAVSAGFPIADSLVDDYTTNYGMTRSILRGRQPSFGSLAPVTAAQIQYQPSGMTVTSCRPRIPARARRFRSSW